MCIYLYTYTEQTHYVNKDFYFGNDLHYIPKNIFLFEKC